MIAGDFTFHKSFVWPGKRRERFRSVHYGLRVLVDGPCGIEIQSSGQIFEPECSALPQFAVVFRSTRNIDCGQHVRRCQAHSNRAG
jgi:hypothetical protein